MNVIGEKRLKNVRRKTARPEENRLILDTVLGSSLILNGPTGGGKVFLLYSFVRRLNALFKSYLIRIAALEKVLRLDEVNKKTRTETGEDSRFLRGAWVRVRVRGLGLGLGMMGYDDG